MILLTINLIKNNDYDTVHIYQGKLVKYLNVFDNKLVKKKTESNRTLTSDCKLFTNNKGQLLDLKRSGDALQALMVKK
jgi:hypothetical protein